MELILVDRSPIFRAGLKAALVEVAGAEKIAVIAECADCINGAGLAARLAPDVVVADLHLGDQNGIELARELARKAPAVRLLMLAAHGPEVIVHQALAAGAAGYLLKEATAEVIVAAIEKVGRGELVLPPGVSTPRRRATQLDRADGLERLSQREREVFDLVIWGRSNKQIAVGLGISTKTVETHRGHINRKLRVHATADLVRLASLLGLLVPVPAHRTRRASSGVQSG